MADTVEDHVELIITLPELALKPPPAQDLFGGNSPVNTRR